MDSSLHRDTDPQNEKNFRYYNSTVAEQTNKRASSVFFVIEIIWLLKMCKKIR